MHGLVIEIEINIDNKPNSSEQEINNLSIFFDNKCLTQFSTSKLYEKQMSNHLFYNQNFLQKKLMLCCLFN